MATSFSYVPVDAITQPTGRFELSETLPAMPAMGWRQRAAKLVVAGLALAFLTGVAVHSATTHAEQSGASSTPASLAADSELARTRAAVVVLASAPVRSNALDLALAQRRAMLGTRLAARGDLDGGVAQLTAALLVIDRIPGTPSMQRDTSLARARVDGSLGGISAQRGQRDRAYLYTRAGLTITEQLLASNAADAEVRALDRELRATLASL